jgi:hypothetical protein
LPAENPRERKNRIGSIGSRVRSSQATNATPSSRPATSDPTTSTLLQPAALPRTRPQTTPNAAPVTSASPARSIAVFGPKLSLICRSTNGIRARPSGTLIQKIHCHASPSAIAPPTTGPLATARPVTPK